MAGYDAASVYHTLKFFTRPVHGWWQTPVQAQNGFWPQAAKAVVDNLGAELLRVGMPLENVREKLRLKIKAQIHEKEAEIFAGEKLLERFVGMFAVMEDGSLRLLTEQQKVSFSQWEAKLGVPITLELANFLWNQQTQFLLRLKQEKSRLESTLRSCEECAPGAFLGLFTTLIPPRTIDDQRPSTTTDTVPRIVPVTVQ